jgi:hypothetical protein
MAKSSDALYLNDRHQSNIVRFLGSDGPQRYVDGTTDGTQPPPTRPPGNPWKETGEPLPEFPAPTYPFPPVYPFPPPPQGD